MTSNTRETTMTVNRYIPSLVKNGGIVPSCVLFPQDSRLSTSPPMMLSVDIKINWTGRDWLYDWVTI